mmetsp:Transcript_72548/g.200086  ORF Transcript_72548/g.200086 Transcript_72548/m.200086 type:complete len:360 (-) Transcript_72548:80-1159(-)
MPVRLTWRGYGHRAFGATTHQRPRLCVAREARKGTLRPIHNRRKRQGTVGGDVPEKHAAVQANRDNPAGARPSHADLHVVQGAGANECFSHLSTAFAVPHPNLPVPPCGHDAGGVGCPRRRPEAAGDTRGLLELLDEVPVLAGVQAELRVGARRDDPLAVGRVPHCVHKVRMLAVRPLEFEWRSFVECHEHVLSTGHDAEGPLRPEGDGVDLFRVAAHLPRLAARVPDHCASPHLLAITTCNDARRVAAPRDVLDDSVPELVLVLLHVVTLRAPHADGTADVTGNDPLAIGRHGGASRPPGVSPPAENVIRPLSTLALKKRCKRPPDDIAAVAIEHPLSSRVCGQRAEGTAVNLRKRRH